VMSGCTAGNTAILLSADLSLRKREAVETTAVKTSAHGMPILPDTRQLKLAHIPGSNAQNLA